MEVTKTILIISTVIVIIIIKQIIKIKEGSVKTVVAVLSVACGIEQMLFETFCRMVYYPYFLQLSEYSFSL